MESDEEEDSSIVFSEEQMRRVDVPGDGSCLFWAVALPYLIQVNNNPDLFNERFERLFGAKELSHSPHVCRLINEFHSSHHNSDFYKDEILRHLVTRVFRHKVVDHMSQCEDEFYESISIEDFKDTKNEAFITDGTFRRNFERICAPLIEASDILVDLDKLKPEVLDEKTMVVINNELEKNFMVKLGCGYLLHMFMFSMYLEAMRSCSCWGGKREIEMMKRMLGCEILVNPKNLSVPVPENSIICLFNNQRVHYQFFLIKAQFLIEFIEQNYSEEKSLKYLKSGVDEINFQNSNGSTLLHFAAKNNYAKSIHVLINQGADVNARNSLEQTPLDIAIALNAQKFIAALVNCARENSNLANEIRAINSKIEMAEKSEPRPLLEYNEVGRNVVHVAAEEGNGANLEQIISQLVAEEHLPHTFIDIPIKGERKQTALHLAAKNNRVKAVDILLEYKAEVNVRDVNIEGFSDLTPLHYATEKGHLEIVKLLIEKGKAEVDAPDCTEGTPLQRAVRFGQLRVVQYLVEIGADVNSKDQKSASVLSHAAKAGCFSTAHFLVEKGAEINAVDKNSVTPLHHAVDNSKWEVVKYLVERGADPNVKSKRNNTALTEVVKVGQWRLAKCLLENGALTEGLTEEQISEILRRNSISLEGYGATFSHIVLGNVELLEKHIDQSVENNPIFLNECLPQTYETIKLMNVPISPSVSLLVESHVIQGRLFSGRKINEIYLNSDESDVESVERRISLTVDAIKKLREHYLNFRFNEISDEFIFAVRFIAQNMQILKNELRFSYDKLPWIEMQFCLVTFASGYITGWENVNRISTLVLNAARLMKHLMNFETELQKLKVDDKFDNKYPFRNRKEMVDSVVASNSSFRDLYEDYELLRDVYSLNRIESYLNPACVVDLSKGDVLVGEQVILRALQVTGECLKNTIESPNMSDKVHRLLIQLAPENVIKIVTSLRDSLSHVEHLQKGKEVEDQSSSLIDIQKDLIKLKDEITFISLLKRHFILEIFLERISECENMSRVKELSFEIRNYELNDLYLSEKQSEIFNKLVELIENFKLEIINEPKSVEQLFHIKRVDDMVEEYRVRLMSVKHKHVVRMRCIKLLSSLIFEGGEEDIDLIRKIARNEIMGLQFSRNNSSTYTNCFEELSENCYAIYHSLESRNVKLNNLYRQISYIIEFGARKVRSMERFRTEMARDMNNFDDEIEKMEKMEKTANNILRVISMEIADNNEIEKQVEIRKEIFRAKNTLINYYKKVIEIYDRVINFSDNFIDIYYNVIINFFKPLIDFYDLKPAADTTTNTVQFIKLIDENNFDEFYSAAFNLKDLIPRSAFIAVIERIKLREITIEEIFSEFQFDKLIDVNELIDKSLFKTWLRSNNWNLIDERKKIIKDEEKVEILINKNELSRLVDEIKRHLSLTKNSFSALVTNVRLKLNKDETFKTLFNDFSFSKCKTTLNSLRRTDGKLLDSFGKLLKDVSKESEIVKLSEPFIEFITSLNVKFSLEAKNSVGKAFEIIKNEQILRLRKYFFEKLDILTTLFPSDKSDLELLTLLKTDDNIRIAVEMLVLNLTETLDQLSLLEPNRLYLDEFSPVLVGKNLRNYLAHGDPLINILPTNYLISLITHFRLFQREFQKDKFFIGEFLIGKVTKISLLHVERYYQIKLKSIDSKDNLFALARCSQSDQIRMSISTRNSLLLKVRDILGNTLLHYSVRANSLSVFQHLLQHGLSLFLRNMYGCSSLHSAVDIGSERIIEFLLNNGFDSSFIVENGYTLLHLAAGCGQLEIVKLLLRYGANIEADDNAKRKPIFDAVRKGHRSIVTELLNAGSDLEWRDISGQTLIHLATSNVEILKILIERKVNVNAVDYDFNTPLRLASSAGKEEIVKVLLDNEANVNNKNKDGATALHQVAQVGDTKIVELLLRDESIDIDTQTPNGSTALHLASFHGHRDVVSLLLKNGADVNKKNGVDCTALHIAALGGHVHVIDILLDYQAEIDCLSEGTEPVLQFAADSGATKVFERLLDRGANMFLKGMNGLSVLHVASLNGNVEMMELILEKLECLGKSELVNEKDDKGRTALHLAVEKNKIEAINLLIEKGADLEAKDFNQRTPIFYSAVKGYADIFNVLLSKGASIINVTDNGGWSVGCAAVAHNNLSIAKTLIKYNVTLKQFDDMQSESGMTALHYAAQNGHLDAVKFLLKNGAEIDTTNVEGWTALHFAALNGHVEIVAYLLKKNHFLSLNVGKFPNSGNDKYVNSLAINESTALHVAAGHGHVSCVNLLIENGANVNATALENCTALHLAAINGHKAVVVALVRKGVNVDARGENGSTALHFAARYNFVEVVETLLVNGANINSVDNVNRQTALHRCCSLGHEEVALSLLQRGAKVDTADANNWSALHCAANVGNVEIIRALLDHKAEIDAKDLTGWTPLLVATHNGHVDAVEHLLAHEAEPNAQVGNGISALHFAIINGFIELAKVILKCEKTEVDLGDVEFRTPLHMAAKYGHAEVVRMLLDNKANANALDKNRATPLHFASIGGHVESVRLLLTRGAIVDCVMDDDELTPLHVAAEEGHLDVLVELIKFGANVNSKTTVLATTPLHLAIENNHVNVVNHILTVENIDIEANNIHGATPLHLATLLGNLELVDALIKAGANVNSETNKHKYTPLYLATKSANSRLIKLLAENGAEMDGIIIIEDNDTILDLAAQLGSKKLVEKMLLNMLIKKTIIDLAAQ